MKIRKGIYLKNDTEKKFKHEKYQRGYQMSLKFKLFFVLVIFGCQSCFSFLTLGAPQGKKDGYKNEIKRNEYGKDIKNSILFELVNGVAPADIVLARNEHPGVIAAAKDLQRDITKITGVTPNIVHSLKEAGSKCVIIGSADNPDGVALLSSVNVPVDELSGKWELFKYEIRNNVGGKEQVLAIAGSNLRGTIFGIYDFEQKNMGVDPLWFWSDNEPPHTNKLIFDDSINFSSLKEPTWKYRGWSFNDHPQLMEWLESGLVQRTRYSRYMFVIHPEVFERFYEAALRLKMNMFTWYFIDIDWKPDWEQLKAQVDRGLFITQHQMEGLGADAGFWDYYWDNHNPEGKPAEFSYLKHPESFREFWSYYINRWVKFSPHVVWELNQRGWADARYTEVTLPNGGTDQQRAEIISKAISEQAKLVMESDPNPDLEMMTTLYAEMGMYYDSGWINLPPNVTTGFSDKGGMQSMSDSKKFWTEIRESGQKYGQYFHTQYFGGGPQIAKCTPLDTYVKVNMDAMYERGDTTHMLLAMNTLRHQQLEIRGIAEMLWDYKGFDYDDYLLKYCKEEFGEQVSTRVAQLYKSYYDKYPHEIKDNGFIKYPVYYKVMEPLFTVIANLLNIEEGTTDGLALHIDYNREKYEQGIKDFGELLDDAYAVRPLVPEKRSYFFDYEFIDAIRMVRGIYKLSITTQDAIANLKEGNRQAALGALMDAQPLTLELYDAFCHQKETDKWQNWFRSDTNKDFYLLYNLYQKARLKLETETMDVVTNIEPQRHPFMGNVAMHNPANEGDAVYSAQAERLNESVWNGSPYSIMSFPIEGAFQIRGVIEQNVAPYFRNKKFQWSEIVTDYNMSYKFNLKGKATVYVACHSGEIPGWLQEDGFSATGKSMEIGHWGWPYRYQDRLPDEVYDFEIFAKEFPAGEVELGKNMNEGLPYIVFVKPSCLIYENFSKTGFNNQPEGWSITENGGKVTVTDIPDYDSELRPSIFDLTTVPRYTPLDLRGLNLRSTSKSTGASIAEYRFKVPAESDFTITLRWKAGQEDLRTGFALLNTNGNRVLEVTMTAKGVIAIQTGDGVEQVIAQYKANHWYNIKLMVSPQKGKASMEVQDDQLNVTSSGELKMKKSTVIEGLKLIHSKGSEGKWILYHAINGYLN